MNRGIYITANDKVLDQTIALLNSIRLFDPETPIIMIPYDDNHQQIAQRLGQDFGVSVFEDADLIERVSTQLHSFFGKNFFARANQFRKQVCWYGPFDQFLYIDTDIVVFNKIIDILNYLDEYDFLCYDYQHKGGIQNIFTSEVFEAGVFQQRDIKSLFNCGFWASKKNLISEQVLYETFQECANHPEYFDFSQKTSDQPIINYMILKQVARRFNVVHRPEKAPGSWAGSSHFQPIGSHQLNDPSVDQAVDYLHWAGIRIQPGCPYWDIWKYYRALNDPNYQEPTLAPSQDKSLEKSLKGFLNNFIPAQR